MSVDRSGAAGAVFLSYAHEDAAAALRLCKALRAAGVEVWFDQSELRGGDAWDAKIRQQIKECALFVPIISANTQARPEGYFRLEWRLADQRTHLMGKSKAFLVPVCIDDTRDSEADVPDSFTSVQWTRISDADSAKAFAVRVTALLVPGRPGPGALQPAQAGLPSDARADSSSPNLHGETAAVPTRRWLALGAAAVLGLGAIAFWQWPRSAVPASNAEPPGATAAPAKWTPRDPDLAKAWALITDLDFTWDDLEIAEDMVKQVLSAKPGDADARIVQTWAMALSLSRGADPNRERQTAAIAAGERAVRLAEENPWALAGLAKVLPDPPRAEKLARRAIDLNPHEARFYGVLSEIVAARDREESIQLLVDAAKLLPGDPLIPWEIKNRYVQFGREEEGDVWLDKSIELRPTGPALLFKASRAFLEHQDLDTVRRMLERLPDKWRLTDRAVFWRYIYARYSGQPDYALQALEMFPRPMIRDHWYTGTKAVLIADLLCQAGKAADARARFEPLLAAWRQEAAASPGRPPKPEYVQLLFILGHKDEAVRAAERFPPDLLKAHAQATAIWFNPVLLNLVLDRREAALEAARVYAAKPTARRTLRFAFAHDPHLKPWREDSEFKAILAEPAPAVNPAAIAAAPSPSPNPKSIAVLPFENLSPDKENEFFADGVHEEVLATLFNIRELRAISRTTVAQYKGARKTTREIGRELGVRYVLSSTVRRDREKVRIIATLLEAASEEQVKVMTYTKELTDIFAIQSELATAIAEALRAAISPDEQKLLDRRPTKNLQAYDLYLKARTARLDITNRGLMTTVTIGAQVDLLRQAVELDAEFAEAWAALAVAESLLYFYGVDRNVAQQARAQAAIERGTRLAPEATEIIQARGEVYYRCFGDYARAAAEYDKLIARGSKDPDLYHLVSLIRRREGNFSAATAALRHAVELEPSFAMGWHLLAQTALQGRRFADCRLSLQKLVELTPTLALSRGADLARITFLERGSSAEMKRWVASLSPADLQTSEVRERIMTWAMWQGELPELLKSEEGIDADMVSVTAGGEVGRFVRVRLAVNAGFAHLAAGDRESARRRVVDFRARLSEWLAREPQNGTLWRYMALIETVLGNREPALHAARQAIEYTVGSEMHGGVSFNRHVLAIVHAWVGDKNEALKEIAFLLERPGAWHTEVVNVHVMKNDPRYFPLRGDPRFEALINDPKNNAPLF